MKPNKTSQILFAILMVALALRVSMAIVVQHLLDQKPNQTYVIEGDANGYWELGEKLLRGEPYFIHNPPRHVLRMPGLPAMVAAAVQISEWLGMPEKKYLIARILMAVVGVLACGLVYVLGARLLDQKVGLLAAGFCAVSPVMAGFSAVLLSETLFAATVMLSLISLHALYVGADNAHCELKSDGSGQPHFCGKRFSLKAVIAGICISIACYARPSWLLVGPVWMLFLLFKWGIGRRVVLAWSGMTLGILLALAPWIVRNYGVTGHFVPLTLWVGPSLYDGLNPEATGDSDMEFFNRDRLMTKMSEYEVNKEYQRRAWEFVKNNPGKSIQLGAAKLWRYLKPWPNAAQFQSNYLRIAVCLFYVPLLFFSGVAVWKNRKRLEICLLLVGPVLYFAVLHSIFVGSLRYRLPAEYPLSIAAAWGVLFWFDSRRRKTASQLE